MIKQIPTRYHPNFSYYSNDDVIGRSLELYGEYGQQELDFLMWVCDNRYTVYDVGANIGVYAAAFASCGARVYSFEPHPKNYQLLKENTKNLTNVHCYNQAIGKTMGRTFIEDFDPSVIGNYGSLSTKFDQGVEVDMMALDYLDIPMPNLLKIDVEGRELDVLLGCEKKIAKSVPCIVYEAHETEQFAEIYHFLKQFDYRLYWLQCMNYNPKNFKNNQDNIFENTALFSVVAWPPSWPLTLTAEEVTGADDDWHKFEGYR
jgi:FkbM family methyltransferase